MGGQKTPPNLFEVSVFESITVDNGLEVGYQLVSTNKRKVTKRKYKIIVLSKILVLILTYIIINTLIFLLKQFVNSHELN